MRIIATALLLAIVFSACTKKKTTDNSTTCISGTGGTAGWTTQDLNLKYTVEFPDWYTGIGYISYNGDYFTKYSYSSSDTVQVNAKYGPGSYTNVWGDVLANSDANAIDFNYRGFIIPLNTKKRLCNGGTTIGYYYYTLTRNKIDTTATNGGLGIVYLMENNDFKQSIVLDFAAAKEYEATSIVSSIKPK